jgi:hypothetical protein
MDESEWCELSPWLVAEMTGTSNWGCYDNLLITD